jgi:alkanesulfonate monooxygenase SsuD/methylene tetrahydromethanopterin reductase-like flavin-dependent oxidoreductase (luciferase family)
MQIDLRTPPSHSVAKTVEFARQCEDAGFSGCGFNDAQMYLRDPYVVMASVLAGTEHLRVHPAVACPGPRHASVIASSAKTTQEFGADRFELWLGRGDTAPKSVGLPQLSIDDMRKAVIQITGLMNGDPNVYESLKEGASFSRLHHGGDPPVPVYLTAHGPVMMRMAGELASGVLMSVSLTEEGLAQGRAWVAEGAARAGRSLSDVHEVVMVPCLIRDTKKEAVRWWSPNVLRVLASPGAEKWLLERSIQYNIISLKPKFQEAMVKLQKLYPEPAYVQDWAAAVKIAEVVPQDLQEIMGDEMAVLGDPDQVTHEILKLKSLGVNRIFLRPCELFRFPEEELQAFKEVIGPALKKAS